MNQNQITTIIPLFTKQLTELHDLNYDKEKIIEILNVIYNDNQQTKNNRYQQSNNNTQFLSPNVIQQTTNNNIQILSQNQIQQPNTKKSPIYPISLSPYHKKDKCKPYCQKNGSDNKCALRCSKCDKFGHYDSLCGKYYCCRCDTEKHKYNDCPNK